MTHQLFCLLSVFTLTQEITFDSQSRVKKSHEILRHIISSSNENQTKFSLMLCELSKATKIRQIIFEGDPQNELVQYLADVSDLNQFLITPYQIGRQRVNTLIVAAMRGHNHIVKLLLNLVEDRSQLIEYCGKIYATGQKRMETGTALWCACDRGHYQVARTLMELGRARFDFMINRSILIVAVLRNRLDIVHFLIENESKIGHSLGFQFSIRKRLLVEAIIHNKSNVFEYLINTCINFDKVNEQMDYILHNAAALGSLKIVELLCNAGAFTNMKNLNDLTPIMIAVHKNRWKIVKYMLERNDVDTNIRQLELAAVTLMKWTSRPNPIETNIRNTIVKALRLIFELREKYHRPKMMATPIRAYGFRSECRTEQELDLLVNDIESLMIEILLIQERLYVSENNETVFQALLRFGDRLVSQKKYQQCLYLWVHTFYLYQSMKLVTTLHRFVWLFCLMLRDDEQIFAEDFVEVGRLVFEPSQNIQDNHVKNATCLAIVAVEIIKKPTISNKEKEMISQWIFDLCRQQMRTTNGQTILHLAVDASLNNDINFRDTDIRNIIK